MNAVQDSVDRGKRTYLTRNRRRISVTVAVDTRVSRSRLRSSPDAQRRSTHVRTSPRSPVTEWLLNAEQHGGNPLHNSGPARAALPTPAATMAFHAHMPPPPIPYSSSFQKSRFCSYSNAFAGSLQASTCTVVADCQLGAAPVASFRGYLTVFATHSTLTYTVLLSVHVGYP